MYSREQIDKVRSAVDIVDVIRGYVPSLKAAGRSIRGLCPFHHEKTPSFFVQAEKGLYKCFGCGEAGDVIAFVSKLEQATFSESLERLASQAGVVLQKSVKSDQAPVESSKEKIYRLLEHATRFYETQLIDSVHGSEARKYLKKRGINENTLQEFRLGWAPFKGGSAFETLLQKGFSIDLCQQAGLVSRSQAGRYYDPLFGRLIFPILDHFGRVIGFGGRVLPKSKKGGLYWNEEKESEPPKYLNSPETLVFSKGRTLYGLKQAKSTIMEQRRVVILEGYMDVIMAHQGGFPLAVATLGTALTRDHAKLMKRYADEAVAFFDPDEAGQKAALRGFPSLLQENVFPRVVATQGTLDPDEVILKEGPQAFEALLEKAPDFVEYVLNVYRASGHMSLQDKAKVAQQILTLIGHSQDEILKASWISQVAERLGVGLETLEKQIKRLGSRWGDPSDDVPQKQPQRPGVKLPTAEEEYLQLVLNSQALWNDLGLESVDFSVERNKKIFEMIVDQLGQKGKLDFPCLADACGEPEKEWFLRLALEEKNFSDPLLRRDQLIRDIRRTNSKKRLAHLSQRIATGVATSGEREEYLSLLKLIKGASQVETLTR